MRPAALLALFCCSALLLFADRGVIGCNSVNGKRAADGQSGYGIQGDFDLSLPADGLLAAALMTGLMLSAPTAAQLSRHYPSLKLISAGLRLLVGAACGPFIALAAPLIDDLAPPPKKSLWLALLFVCIPTGFAVGFLFGGLVGTALGWRAAFAIEAAAMVPIAAAMLLAATVELRRSSKAAAPSPSGGHGGGSGPRKALAALLADCKALAASPVCLATLLALSAYNGALGCYAFYGPKAARDIFQLAPQTADLLFGGITVLTGVLGTLCGGLALDAMGPSVHNALLLCTGGVAAGCVLAALGFAYAQRMLHFGPLFAGSEFGMFLMAAPVNAVLLWSVPPELRPFALSAAEFTQHLLGDIPSPPALGWLQGRVNNWRLTMLVCSGLLAVSAALFLVALRCAGPESYREVAVLDEGELADQEQSEQLQPAGAAPAATSDAAVLLAHLRDYRASAEQARGARHSEEVKALLAIKAAFSGWDALEDYGIHLQGWQSDSGNLRAAGAADPCTWTFVDACDSQGRVMQLHLSRFDLFMLTRCQDRNVSTPDLLWKAYYACTPNLTASLQDLAAPVNSLAGLNQLSIPDLDLTGSLPSEWGSPDGLLSHLRLLDVSRNAITGSIPHAWSWLRSDGRPSLQHLSLDKNQLVGTLPPWLPVAFPHLKANFIIASQQPGGTYPQRLDDASSVAGLKLLDLSDNPLKGTLPPAHFHHGLDNGSQHRQEADQLKDDDVVLASLVSLHLRNCSLIGTLPADWAFYLGALQYLRLDGNQLTGRLPDEWAEASWSERGWKKNLNIYLTGNSLSGPVPNFTEFTIQVWPGNEGLCAPPATQHSSSTVSYNENRKQCKQSDDVGAAAVRAVQAALSELAGESVEGAGLGSLPEGPHCLKGIVQVQLPQCSTGTAYVTGRQSGGGSPVTAAAAGAAALAALLAALGVRHHRRHNAASGGHTNHHRQLCRMARAEVEVLEQDGDLELSRLLAHGILTSSASPRSLDSVAAAAAGSPTASWRLHSTSLRLQPRDFQIAVDATGRPELLGSGAFSKVYRGLLFGHCPVAIKVLNQPAAWQPLEQSGPAAAPAGPQLQQQQQQQQQQQLLQFWKEADVLRRCLHPNIVQLLGVYSSSSGGSSGASSQQHPPHLQPPPLPPRLMLVTELLEGGSLQQRLAAPSLRWWQRGGEVVLDVARAVAFLHHRCIAHLDIKPANVLLVRDPQGSSSSGGSFGGRSSVLAKLADVGMSHVLGVGSMLPGCGTPLYAAPEQLINGPCGLASDLFSLGLVLHGIASGQRLVRRGDAWPLRSPQDCPAAVVSLIQSCLHQDPAARPSAAEVVRAAVLLAHLRDYRASAEQARGARHPEEVKALLAIKAAFSGWDALEDYGIHLQGWQSDSGNLRAAGAGDPCTWTFVHACDSQGRVMQLGMSRFDFLLSSGCQEVGNWSTTNPVSWPPDILRKAYHACTPNLTASLQDLAAPVNSLAGLSQLSIPDLDLTGSLPSEWGSPDGLLSHLRRLDVSQNAITGSIPHAWSWLRSNGRPSLQHLSLDKNQLTLSLRSNNHWGTIPEAWLTKTLWTGLELLDVSDNPLRGSLPPAFFSYEPDNDTHHRQEHEEEKKVVALPSLVSLHLRNCSLIGTLPADWAFHLGSLRYLSLDGNQLTGRLPDKWAEASWSDNGWPTNIEIHLEGNALSGPVPNFTKFFIEVRPGNEGLCMPSATQRSSSTVKFTEHRNDIKLPQCSTGAASVPGRQSGGGSPVTAAAAGAATLAALLAALGVRHHRRRNAASSGHTNHHRQLCRMARAEVEVLEQDGDLELSRLLAHGILTSSASPRSLDSVAATAAGSPTASWRLHSSSLRLQPRDFQIAVDATGRPELLGSGAFSKVYRGLLFGHCPVAIKVLNQPAAWQPLEQSGPAAAQAGPQLQQQQQQQQLSRFWKEADVLRCCLHPNIVQLLGVYSSSSGGSSGASSQQHPPHLQPPPLPPRLMLVTELLEGGSLQERLAAPSLRWWQRGCEVALDVARAVAFLHHRCIAHLDIKPANVLLVRDPQGSNSSGGSFGGRSSVLAKLADVGMSHVLGVGSMLPGCGTPLYAAPEQLINGPCGLASDLFSLGLVLHGIASGQRLVRRGDARPLRSPQDCPAAVVSLIQSCLHRDPTARPSAAEVVRALVRAAYSGSTDRQAEAELAELSRTGPALEWAMRTLDDPQAVAVDMHAAFFACATAAAATRRYPSLDPAHRAALRECLWRSATDPGLPHFVRAKSSHSLAHIVCLEWPQGWPALHACLSDPARVGPAVDLLSATLEHFHSLSLATSFNLTGKVLYASLPSMQQRLCELQPMALTALCQLLQSLAGSLPAAVQAGEQGTATLALVSRALRVLRQALANAATALEKQELSSSSITHLLFNIALTAAAPRPGSGGEAPAEEAALEVAAAALDCAADLQTLYLGREQTQQMLEALDMCGLIEQRWAREQAAGGGRHQVEDCLLTSFVRLLIQFISGQLSTVEASPGLAASLRGILGAVLQLTTARRSPLDLLLFLEVWHAVLNHLDSFEEQLWEAENDPQTQQRVQAAVAVYKEPLMAVCGVVLAVLCPAAAVTGLASPPIILDSLSTAPGGGAALDDWLAAVVAGGDAGAQGGHEAQEERAGEGNVEEEEEEEERGAFLVSGAMQGATPFQEDSEADAFVRHAESFLGRAIGSFSAELLPRVLLSFQASSMAFAAACQQVTAAAQAAEAGREAAAAAAALGQLLPSFRELDACLRLLTRCGPSFPIRGAAEAPPTLSASDGGEPPSGATAVQSLRALCQLAAVWLHSVQALVGAIALPEGQPSTPIPLADTGVGGSREGLSAMLLAGSRVYKTVGSLTATWLSQLVLGLVQGTADPDAAAVAQELLQCVLSAAADLLQAATSAQMAGWQPALHRATLWAAESLVALTSIALSSSVKPPVALLEAVWSSPQVQKQLLQVAAAGLGVPPRLPMRACRALGLTLSDLSLRSWPAQPAAQFSTEQRSAAFDTLANPLVQLLRQAAAVSGGGLGPEAAAAVRQAAAVAACVVQSYSGSSKALRSIVSTCLVSPALPSVIAILQAGTNGGSGGTNGGGVGRISSKAAEALLRLVEASLEVLATELGDDAVEQLLGALLRKHQSLLWPALRYCLGVWERTASAQADSAADVTHVRAAALAALLALLRYRWRQLAGSSGTAGGRPAVPPAPEGVAAIERVVQLLVGHFEAAAAQQVVLAAADVRLVLEEVFELQVATKLFSHPAFQPARGPLAAALLGMLVSRLYGSAQDALGDTLFSLAAANWTELHTHILPRFLEARLAPAGLGASELGALLALFGQADLDAHSFEKALLAFLNDAAFYARTAAEAGV
ncbi:putative sphingolipid transporter spinster 2 [Chlorella vulgaris]